MEEKNDTAKRKPFMLKYEDEIGQWVPKNEDGTQIVAQEGPENPMFDEFIVICLGSQWVNVGGRWYQIG